jgi:DNA modification methylase
MKWAADKIVKRRVSTLKRYEQNARTHSAAQIEQIRASMREWGFTIPILIDENNQIIAGHGRLEAALLEEYRDVPCLVAVGWTDAQKRAYVIADNKLAQNAGWDDDLLRSELSSLEELGFQLGLIGFSEQELGELVQDDLHPGGNTGDDEVPAAELLVKSKIGDVWLCGEHRVMCGDSTVPDYVTTLCAGQLVDCCWTDPPYNVNYQGSAGVIENDHMGNDDFAEFLLAAMRSAFLVLKAGGPIYVAHADTEGFNFRNAFMRAGFKLSGSLVWVKNSLVLGRSDYQWKHEPILYGWKPGAAHTWYGGRAKTTVIEAEDLPFDVQEDGSVLVQVAGQSLVISGSDLHVEGVAVSVIRAEKPKRSAEHPTMKPVALIEDMLRNSTKRRAVVLDLFGGSGSTLIAAHKMGRVARLMEYDPKFADVIVKRWQDYTGQKATLEASGKRFDEVRAVKQKKAAA